MGSKSKLAVVIMAAGKGTRLKSRRPKVLHEIGGKPLLGHVIAAAERAGGFVGRPVGARSLDVASSVAGTAFHLTAPQLW